MKFIKNQMTPSDMVAIMEYGGELKVLQDFTNDRDQLAKTVGKLLAERAVAKGIKDVVFDRGGYLYHGRIKALADAAREGGLNF